MDTPMVATRTFGRKPLAALGKVTLTALLGMALVVAYVMFVIFGEADPMALTLGGIPLIGAAVPKPGTAAGVSHEILAELPPLRTEGFEFEQSEIRANVGETVALRLENGAPESHSFDIDELNVHAPMPAGQTGLALFKPTKPGTYTFYCAPHYDKASGQGMKGTLIVTP